MSTKWCMHEPNSYKKATHCHWAIISIQTENGKGKGQFGTIVFFFWAENPINRSQMCTMCLLNLWFYPFNCILDRFLKIITSNQSKHIYGTFVNLFVKNDNRFMKANRVAEIKCQRMYRNGNPSNEMKSFDRPNNKPKLKNFKMELIATLS